MGDHGREQALVEALARGVSAVADLATALGRSAVTVSRQLRALERDGRVVRTGTTRGARYYGCRSGSVAAAGLPLYRVTVAGDVQAVGSVHALAGERYLSRSTLPRLTSLSDGLPYFLQDARPAGFLGRALPAAWPELELPARVTDWTDEHCLRFLSQRGSDVPGDLVLGTVALDRWWQDTTAPVPVADRSEVYPRLAAAALAGDPPGSSAQGEQPKFTVCVLGRDGPSHRLVKFSPPVATSAGRRWADLLCAEAEAHALLRERGIAAAKSEWFLSAGRAYLDVERFDRQGARGRLGVVSLHAYDAHHYARLDSWTAAAGRLRHDGIVSAPCARQLALLDAFGHLIDNNDRHFGNVSFFDDRRGVLALAPVYDMLPMQHAPRDTEPVPATRVRAAPRTEWLGVWNEARSMALEYWQRVAALPLGDPAFAAIATSRAADLALAPTV